MFDEAGNLKLIDLGACRGKEIICDKKFMKEAYSAPEQYTTRTGLDRGQTFMESVQFFLRH